MSTSLLYHAFGLKGVKYIRARYRRGSTIFHAEVTGRLQRCPECSSHRTIRKRGSKLSWLRMAPVGYRPEFVLLKVWRIRCEDCGALRRP